MALTLYNQSGSQDPDCPKVLVDKEEYKGLKQKAATLTRY